MATNGETPRPEPSGQPSATGIQVLLSDAAAARAAMAKRIRVTTTALRDAAGVYADTDAQSATDLAGQVVV